MKRIAWVGLVVLIVGCGRDSVLPIIPGLYVAEWKSEFASSRDTLLVTRREGSNVFAIERRTRHVYDQRIREQPPQHKVVHWVGIYDDGVKALYVQSIGRVMVFDPGSKEMRMGIVVYKKL